MDTISLSDCVRPTVGVMAAARNRAASRADAEAEALAAFVAAYGERPAPVVYEVTQADIDQSLPAEYRGAVAIPALVEAVINRGTVILLGPPGTGKTRQLYGLLRHHRARIKIRQEQYYEQRESGWRIPNREKWAARSVAEIVAQDKIEIISESTDVRGHRHDRAWLASAATHPGLLCVDDVGCVKPDTWVQEAIYELSTQRRMHDLRTVWTTNLSPEEFRSQFGAAITSRLLGGEALAMDGADRRLA